jgi:hypothetical protein
VRKPQTIVLPSRPVIEAEPEPGVDEVRARSRFDAIQDMIRHRRSLRRQPAEAFINEDPGELQEQSSGFLLRRSE